MLIPDEPLVCVLTPVYNGEEFLEECIESVRAQTYRNFRHIIVNNCSTDRTLEIANRYAMLDPRIEVRTNDKFVSLMDNHNIAFRQTPPDAAYCKILSADDLLFPEFLARMIEAAGRHPSAGFVGCYQLSGTRIRWQGFPYPKTLMNGRELARWMFRSRDASFGFGAPTSLLYRADIVRTSDAFYPNHFAHADTSVFYRYLAECDFAFVYQVLCIERLDPNSATPRAAKMREEFPGTLSDLIEYGHHYFNPEELERIVREHLGLYHATLAADVMAGRGKEYLAYHRRRLEELGYPLTKWTLVKAGIRKVLNEIANPEQFISKLRRRAGAGSSKASLLP